MDLKQQKWLDFKFNLFEFTGWNLPSPEIASSSGIGLVIPVDEEEVEAMVAAELFPPSRSVNCARKWAYWELKDVSFSFGVDGPGRDKLGLGALTVATRLVEGTRLVEDGTLVVVDGTREADGIRVVVGTRLVGIFWGMGGGMMAAGLGAEGTTAGCLVTGDKVGIALGARGLDVLGVDTFLCFGVGGRVAMPWKYRNNEIGKTVNFDSFGG